MNDDHDDDTEPAALSAKDELLALALARGVARAEAAILTGYSDRTIRRRMATTAFKARVAALRSEMATEALGKLSDAATKAVDRLVTLLDSDSDGVALNASVAILNQVVKYRDHAELVGRIEELEEAARS